MSILLNRRGQVMAGAALFTVGLAAAIAGSQLNLLTPMAPADPDLLQQMRRGIEAAQADTARLQGYLSRFV